MVSLGASVSPGSGVVYCLPRLGFTASTWSFCSWNWRCWPRKHGVFTQCCFNVGPASKTLGQHWNSIGWMPRDCWGDMSQFVSGHLLTLWMCPIGALLGEQRGPETRDTWLIYSGLADSYQFHPPAIWIAVSRDQGCSPRHGSSPYCLPLLIPLPLRSCLLPRG